MRKISLLPMVLLFGLIVFGCKNGNLVGFTDDNTDKDDVLILDITGIKIGNLNLENLDIEIPVTPINPEGETAWGGEPFGNGWRRAFNFKGGEGTFEYIKDIFEKAPACTPVPIFENVTDLCEKTPVYRPVTDLCVKVPVFEPLRDLCKPVPSYYHRIDELIEARAPAYANAAIAMAGYVTNENANDPAYFPLIRGARHSGAYRIGASGSIDWAMAVEFRGEYIEYPLVMNLYTVVGKVILELVNGRIQVTYDVSSNKEFDNLLTTIYAYAGTSLLSSFPGWGQMQVAATINAPIFVGTFTDFNYTPGTAAYLTVYSEVKEYSETEVDWAKSGEFHRADCIGVECSHCSRGVTLLVSNIHSPGCRHGFAGNECVWDEGIIRGDCDYCDDGVVCRLIKYDHAPSCKYSYAECVWDAGMVRGDCRYCDAGIICDVFKYDHDPGCKYSYAQCVWDEGIVRGDCEFCGENIVCRAIDWLHADDCKNNICNWDNNTVSDPACTHCNEGLLCVFTGIDTIMIPETAIPFVAEIWVGRQFQVGYSIAFDNADGTMSIMYLFFPGAVPNQLNWGIWNNRDDIPTSTAQLRNNGGQDNNPVINYINVNGVVFGYYVTAPLKYSYNEDGVWVVTHAMF